jgi:TP901 family phage tail tape measure protein
MPGEYLTLDIRANDEASPVLREVGQQASKLDAELEGLIRTASRLAGSERETIALFKEQAQAQERASDAARKAAEAEAQLITAQAKMATALAKVQQEARLAEEAKRRLAGASDDAAAAAAREARLAQKAEADLINARTKQAQALAKIQRETRLATQATSRLTEAERQAAREAKALERQRNAMSAANNAALGGLGRFNRALETGGKGGLALNAGLTAAIAGLYALNTAARVGADAVRLQADALLSAIDSSLKFEQEITRVSAVTGGAAGSFDTLRAAALRGGASTLFTAQQAGEGLRFLAQAGLSADQAARALPSSLQLAAAGVLDLAKAADISTNILSGYKFEVSELGRVNDVLVKASTSSNTNVQELGVAFSYVAGVAASTNQEFEDITAILEVLANNGIKGSKSGRALANAISRIQKPTAAGRDVLNDLNISLTDSQGRTKQLVTVLKDFERAGASTAQILTFFGEVAGRSLVTALNSGTAAIDRFATANRNATGTAAEFQRKLQDTASAQVQIFKSTVETAAITIGERFNPNIKDTAKLLTEQANILLKNNDFLDQFDTISNEVVLALASLAAVSAEIVPILIVLGGATLEAAKAARFFVDVLRAQNQLISLTTGSYTDLGEALGTFEAVAESGADTFDDFGGALEASANIADEARARLIAVSEGLDDVGTETTVVGRAFETLGEKYSAWIKAAADNREKSLAEQNLDLADSVNILTNAYIGLERNVKKARDLLTTKAPEEQPINLSLEAKRAEAELESEIAGERNDALRAELEYELEVFKIRQQGLDLDIQQSKIKTATFKLEQKLDSLTQKRTSRGRKAAQVDVASLLAQEELARRLITTEDERAKVQLRFEQALLRINASKDAEALKASKRQTAEAERDQALQALAKTQADQLIASQVEALRLRASMVAETDKLLSIELERQAAALELSGQRGLAQEVRDLREQSIAQKAVTDEVKARKEEAQQAAAKQIAFLRSEATLLERSTSIVAQRQAIELEREAKIAEINASEVEQRTKVNQLALVELEATKQLLDLKRKTQLVEAERLSGIQQGLAAGLGTDVTGLLGQASGERQGAINDQIAQLQAQKASDSQSGADTTLLERRITLLQQEAEAERQSLELQKQRIQATEAATTALGTLVLKTAEASALGFKGAEAFSAMGAAVSATAALGGALASALNLPAKQAAKLQVAFNVAAAIAAGAAYAASGYTAFPLLQAAIQHGVAAAKFGAIAGGAGGGGASIPRGGGSGSAGGSAASAAGTFNANAERERTAAAFARALRDELARPSSVTMNIDYGSSTQLAKAPDVARELQRTLGASAATLFQAGITRDAG